MSGILHITGDKVATKHRAAEAPDLHEFDKAIAMQLTELSLNARAKALSDYLELVKDRQNT